MDKYGIADSQAAEESPLQVFRLIQSYCTRQGLPIHKDSFPNFLHPLPFPIKALGLKLPTQDIVETEVKVGKMIMNLLQSIISTSPNPVMLPIKC